MSTGSEQHKSERANNHYRCTFVKLRKATISFVMSIRPSVCRSVWNNSAPTDRIIKFGISDFSKNCWENSSLIKIRYTNTYVQWWHHQCLVQIKAVLLIPTYLLLLKIVNDLFAILDAFAKLWKATVSCVMSVSPNRATRLPLDGFWWNFVFEFLSKPCLENSSFIKIQE